MHYRGVDRGGIFIIRIATQDDIPEILAVIEEGREYLRVQGLPQWQGGYGPSPELVKRQVAAAWGCVYVQDGRVAAYGALVPGPEAEYEAMCGWRRAKGPYVAIHSVAVQAGVRGRGVGRGLVSALTKRAYVLGFRDVRVDTYPSNAPMLATLERVGFAKRGDILLDVPNGERVAYQKLPEAPGPDVRLADLGDIDAAEAIIDSARAFLAQRGLPQWQGGYGPNRDSVVEAVSAGDAFVLEVDGRVCAYASLDPGPDPDCDTITGGSWAGASPTAPQVHPYAVINNVAMDASTRGRGFGKLLIRRLTGVAMARGHGSVRSCTRTENILMRRSFEAAGFVHVGDMVLGVPHGERMAYELIF